jgi:hypothetical protein
VCIHINITSRHLHWLWGLAFGGDSGRGGYVNQGKKRPAILKKKKKEKQEPFFLQHPKKKEKN